MTARQWSLSEELQKIAMAATLREATTVLGLVPAAARTFHLEESVWHETGSDVYALNFDIFCDGSLTGEYVVKASASLGGSQSDVIDEWNIRRAAVSGASVRTPRLFGVGRGLIVEERIPYSLSEAMSDDAARRNLIEALGASVRRLVDAGFRPLSCRGWRSRGDDVVVADFGHDLGAGRVRGDSPESYLRVFLANHLDLVRSEEERDLLYASALDQEFRNNPANC